MPLLARPLRVVVVLVAAAPRYPPNPMEMEPAVSSATPATSTRKLELTDRPEAYPT
jgi:hypothetical protein